MTTKLEINHPHLVIPTDESKLADSLRPANGIVFGLLFSIPMWLVILSVINSLTGH